MYSRAFLTSAILSIIGSGLPATMAVGGDGEKLHLLIHANKKYLVGAPMIVAVELRSAWTGTSYLGSENSPFPARLGYGGEPLRFRLRPKGKPGKVTLGARRPVIRKVSHQPWNYPRFALKANQRVRMLVDMADFLVQGSSRAPDALAAGEYTLAATLTSEGRRISSPEIPIRLVAPSKSDLAALAGLRQASPTGWDGSTWLHRMLGLKEEKAFADLSAPVDVALRPYLFMREVAYGKSLADLPAKLPDSLSTTWLAPEAAAWRYELLVARERKQQARKLKSEIEKHYPGVIWRVKRIDEGNGALRSLVGVWRPKAGPVPERK